MAHVHDSRGCGEPWSLLAAFSFRASRPDPALLSGVVSGLRPSPQENAKMNLAGARQDPWHRRLSRGESTESAMEHRKPRADPSLRKRGWGTLKTKLQTPNWLHSFRLKTRGADRMLSCCGSAQGNRSVKILRVDPSPTSARNAAGFGMTVRRVSAAGNPRKK